MASPASSPLSPSSSPTILPEVQTLMDDLKQQVQLIIEHHEQQQQQHGTAPEVTEEDEDDSANMSWERVVNTAVQKLLDKNPGSQELSEQEDGEEEGVDERPYSALAIPGTPHSDTLFSTIQSPMEVDGNGATANVEEEDDFIEILPQSAEKRQENKQKEKEDDSSIKKQKRAVSVSNPARLASTDSSSDRQKSAPPELNMESAQVRAVQNGQNGAGVEEIENLDDNIEELHDGGEHSIYGIDPTTKKRFYEPHKRPGCNDIYCLSKVTQIGERICNIENKLLQLEDLFQTLVKRRSGEEEPPSSQQQPVMGQRRWPGAAPLVQQFPVPASTSIPIGVQNPHIQLLGQILQPSGSRYTGPSLYTEGARILAQTQQQLQQPPTSSSSFANRTGGLTLKTQQRARDQQRVPLPSRNAGKSTAAAQSGERNKQKHFPIPIPYKPLRDGLRVYFLDEIRRTSNYCNVCFAVFQDPSGKSTSSAIPKAHMNRHLADPLETYYCTICTRGGPQFLIHFLSLPAVVQHLLNQHGISDSPSSIQKGYVKTKLNKTSVAELRNFITKQLHDSPNQTTTMNIHWNGKPVRVSIENPSPQKPQKRKISGQMEKPAKYAKILQPTEASTSSVAAKMRNPLIGSTGRPRRLPSNFVEFNLAGDSLDRLLDCPIPCTLFDRFQRLKTIDRTPMNCLIVNINDSIGEQDFQLANVVAGVEDIGEVASHSPRSSSRPSTKGNNSHRSTPNSPLSSLIDAVASGAGGVGMATATVRTKGVNRPEQPARMEGAAPMSAQETAILKSLGLKKQQKRHRRGGVGRSSSSNESVETQELLRQDGETEEDESSASSANSSEESDEGSSQDSDYQPGTEAKSTKKAQTRRSKQQQEINALLLSDEPSTSQQRH